MANANEEYKKLNAETLKLAQSHKLLEAELRSLIGVQKKLIDQMKKGGTAKQFADAQKAIAKNMQDAERVQQQRLKTMQQAEVLEQKRIRTQEAQARATARQNKETAKQRALLDRLSNSYNKVTGANAKLVGAYKRESAELTRLRNRAKDLAIQYGINSKEFRRAAAEVNNLDRKLRQVDSRLGQHQRNVGNYASAIGGLRGGLQSLAGAFGFVGGIQLFATAMKDVMRISREYEKGNAVLASVLGKTRKETIRLQKESKRLGATTAFSANEVVSLQTELARLGKTEDEIIDSTEGIIDATIALGSETGETAALVGATLNAFQLGAEESSRVADVLTLSTQKSALSFEKLNTALPIVAGAAGAAGVTLEQLVAQLGQAADRGIDASSAASSLRNIYIELAAKGLTLEEALGKINKSQDKLSTATELFGKRAAVTALSLASTTDKTKELTGALEDAGGTAERVADEQLDTLDGRLRLLTSAWEGLILKVNDGDSALGTVAKAGVEELTNKLNTLTNAGLLAKSAVGGFADLTQEEFEQLLTAGKTAGGDLQSLADTFGKIWGPLGQAASSVTGLLGDSVEIADVVSQVEKEMSSLPVSAIDWLARTAAASKGLSDSFDELTEQEKENLALNQLMFQTLEGLGESTDEARIFADRYVETLEIQTTATEATKKAEEEKAKATDVTTEKVRGLIEEQEELLKQAKKLSEATEDDIKFKNQRIETINKEIARLKALKTEQEKTIQGRDFRRDTFVAPSTDMETDKLKASLEAQRQAAQEASDEAVRIKEDEEERKQEISERYQQLAIDSAMQVANTIFSVRQMNREQETQAELLALEERINNEQLDEEQRAELQKQKTEREKQLRRENAVAQKKDALFQVAINTALAIIKQLAATPLSAGGAPFVAAVAAAGAVQAGVIAARPIPQFDKGTKSAPDQFIAGEKRPEFMVHHGRVSLVDTPTLFGKEYKGAEIIGGAESAKILDQATRNEVVTSVSNHRDKKNEMLIAAYVSKEFGKHTDKVVDAIKSNRPIVKNQDINTAILREKLRG